MPNNNSFDLSEYPTYEEKYGTSLSTSKADSLQESRERKLDRLGARSDNTNFSSNTYTVTDDGYKESNGNKLWNDYSASDIQGELASAAKEALFRNEDGSMYQLGEDGSQIPYTGNTRRAYMYGSKDSNRVKFGLSRGDLPSSDYRYIPGKAEAEGFRVGKDGYGWESGDKGVDLSKPMLFDGTTGEAGMLLPYATATSLEGKVHGRKDALEGRSVRDITEPRAMQEYGSGISEYYTSPVGMLGDSRVVDNSVRDTELNAAAEVSSKKLNNLKYRDKDSASILAAMRQYDDANSSRVLNMLKAPFAGAAKYGADFVDTGVEIAGDVVGKAVGVFDEDLGKYIDKSWDLATDNEKAKGINKALGYDDRHSKKQMEKVSHLYDEFVEDAELFSPSTWADLDWSKGGEALKEAFNDPESTLYSVGYIGMALPGLMGKAITKLLSKDLQDASKKITEAATDKSLNVKERNLKVAEVTSKLSKVDRTKLFLVNNSDVLALGAVMNNNQLDEYIENNGGEDATLTRSLVGWLANAGVAKLDVSIMKSIISNETEFAKYLAKVFAEEGKPIASKMVAETVKFAAVAGAAGLKEAPQEWVQTFVESFNKVYGATSTEGEYTDLGEAATTAQREAGIGAIYGMAGGTQMSVAGQTPEALAKLSGGVSVPKFSKKPVTEVPTQQEELDEEYGISPEEREFNVDNVKKSINTLNAMLSKEGPGITERNVHTAVNDIDMTKQFLDTAPDGATKTKVKATYEKGVDSLEGFIKTNPNVKLSKKTIEAFGLEGKVLGSEATKEELEDYDDNLRVQVAEQLARVVLGSGRTYDDTFTSKVETFLTTNDIDKDVAKNLVKSYASVEIEATVDTRGFKTRGNRLKLLLASGNPDKASVKREYGELNSFLNSTSNSVANIEQGIAEAKVEAQTLNDTPKEVVRSKTKQLEIPYKKDDGTLYKINIMKNSDGVWAPQLADLEKTLKLKKSTQKGIEEVLREVSEGVSKYIKGVDTSSGMVVPDTNPGTIAKVVTARKADNTYFANAEDKVKEYAGKGKINKVIIDDSLKVVKGKTKSGKTAKWVDGGDYRKANRARINSLETKDEGYSSDDVVMLHAMGTLDLDGGAVVSSLRKKKDNPVRKELEAALKAGAAVVLDREHRQTATGKRLAKSIKQFIEKQGYTQLPDSGVFVKTDDKVVDKVKETNIAKAKKGVATKKAKKVMAELVVTQAKLLSKVGEDSKILTSKELKPLREEFETKAKELEGTVEEVTKAVNKALNTRVGKLKTELGKKDVADEDKLYEQPYIEVLATKEVQAEVSVDEKVTQFLEGWKVLTEEERLEGKVLKAEVNRLATEVGLDVEAGTIATKVLTEYSLAIGKQPLWEQVERLDTYKNKEIISTEYKYTPKWKEFSPEDIKKFSAGKAIIKGNTKLTPITYRKVENDTTKYLKADKVTVFNTIDTELLPKVFRDVQKSFVTAFKKVIPMAQEAELSSPEEFIRKDGKWTQNVFNLHNSPARGLILDKDGVQPEVAMALKVALMSVVTNDKQKLKKGYKPTTQLAQMFDVREHEVSAEMREFAKDIGAFKKTIATKIGKDALSLLGISKKEVEDISEGSYSRLVADLGNMAIITAEKEGTIEIVSKGSGELATLLGDASDSIYSDKADVDFVNISSVKNEEGRWVPSSKVETLIEDFDKLSELIPEVKTQEVWPATRKPSEEYVERTISKVRNDSIGMEVPKIAKEALRVQMNTTYIFDTAKVGEFLDVADNNTEAVMGVLGYIEISNDNPKYAELPFEDKEVQEAVNNGIEKSIDDLRTMLADNEGKGKVELYFDFNYISNGRYHLDSNTINPQADKLHRFLITPKALENKISTKDNNFTVDGQDVNFMVRASIGQAFGYGVDKESTTDIIEYGNVMLSLNKEQLTIVREEVLTTGEAEVRVGNDKVFKIKAEHYTHTLQALDMLEQNLNGDEVTTSLTLEFDSLTSGFANKTQQFPVLGSITSDVMHEHFARVGVITPEYQENVLKGTVVDPSKGTGMNDLIASASTSGFLDSYKNLAKNTLGKLAVSVKGMYGDDKKYADMYKGLASVLPGSDGVLGKGDLEIDSAMRSMFKNPFMIFNYSASISTITRNLGDSIAKDVFKAIAKADLNKPEDKGTQAAEYLVKSYSKVTGIKTVKALQEAIREEGSAFVGKGRLFKNISKMAYETYGAQVKEVFNEEFGQFIEIQNVTNDAFKVMFRLFDAKRMELLKEAGLKGYVTKADQKEITEKLWNDFPYIAGPLSANGKLKEIIPVISRKVGSPTVLTEGGKPPQTRVLGKPETKKIRPLVSSMDEAASAGSVLPFHFIDGAEIALMYKGFNEYLGEGKEVGLLAIHDAILPSITDADRLQWEYNKGMYELNKGYSIMEKLAERMESLDTNTKYFKSISSKGLNVDKHEETGKPMDRPFEVSFEMVKEQVEGKAKFVKKAREEWYNGPLSNALFANMVGTPAGIYRPGDTKPDMTYIDTYKENYKKIKFVSVGNEKVKVPKVKAKGKDNPKVVAERLRKIKRECKI